MGRDAPAIQIVEGMDKNRSELLSLVENVNAQEKRCERELDIGKRVGNLYSQANDPIAIADILCIDIVALGRGRNGSRWRVTTLDTDERLLRFSLRLKILFCIVVGSVLAGCCGRKRVEEGAAFTCDEGIAPNDPRCIYRALEEVSK